MSNYHDIFLSHSSKDKEYVDSLQKKLTNRGYRIWYDSTNIELANKLQETIEEGLKKSYFGIIVLSDHYLKFTRWTKFEYERIIKNGRVFILLLDITIKTVETDYPEVYKEIKEILVGYSASNGEGLEGVLDKLKNKVQYKIIDGKEEFAELRNLLVAESWSYADEETFKLIYKEYGLLNFPYEDLEIINRLWLIYSDESYGFSIQKKIYIDESKSKNTSNRPEKFFDYVKWCFNRYRIFAKRVNWYFNSYSIFARRVNWRRKKGKWTSSSISHTKNKKGHFPAQVYFVNMAKKEPQNKFHESSHPRLLLILSQTMYLYFISKELKNLGWIGLILLLILFPLLVVLGFFIVVSLWVLNLYIEAVSEFNVWEWLRDLFRSYQLHKFFANYDSEKAKGRG